MSKCKAEHKVMKLPNYTKTLLNSSRANPETHHTHDSLGRLHSLLLPLLSNQRFVNVGNDTLNKQKKRVTIKYLDINNKAYNSDQQIP